MEHSAINNVRMFYVSIGKKKKEIHAYLVVNQNSQCNETKIELKRVFNGGMLF